MNLYLAGPMRGYPEFNFPAFHHAANVLRKNGHTVMSPAEKDIEREGFDISKGNMTGSEAALEKQLGLNPGGFIRKALKEDLDFICEKADAIALMLGWEKSKGARAENATAVALGIRRFVELDDGSDGNTFLEVDEIGNVITPIQVL